MFLEKNGENKFDVKKQKIGIKNWCKESGVKKVEPLKLYECSPHTKSFRGQILYRSPNPGRNCLYNNLSRNSLLKNFRPKKTLRRKLTEKR